MKKETEPSSWVQVNEAEFLEMLDALVAMFSENAEVAQTGLEAVNNEVAKITEWRARGYRVTFYFNAKTRELRVEKHKKKWGLLP